jgi:iron complex transport system ATP-binding protein
MMLTDTLAFRARDFRSLSGGERQRVVLASALAQQPDILLLDEPTTFLDLEHQLSICRILRELVSNGMTVIAVTHDLNLASAFSDRLILIADGTIRADGSPGGVLTPANLESVFHVRADVREGVNGSPWILVG